MSTGRTVDLTFTFVVKREDDYEWPWDITLKSIEPRNPDVCGQCSDYGYVPGKPLCDACGAEESIDCGGPEDWLKNSGIDINKEGTLVVNAYIQWWHISGPDGDDWDDEVHVNWSRWESAPDDDPAQQLERRNRALEKLNALPAFDETILVAPMDEQNNGDEQ